MNNNQQIRSRELREITRKWEPEMNPIRKLVQKLLIGTVTTRLYGVVNSAAKQPMPSLVTCLPKWDSMFSTMVKGSGEGDNADDRFLSYGFNFGITLNR